MEVNGYRTTLTPSEAQWIQDAGLSIFRLPRLAQYVFEARVGFAKQHGLNPSALSGANALQARTDIMARLSLQRDSRKLQFIEHEHAVNEDGSERHVIPVLFSPVIKRAVYNAAWVVNEIAREDTMQADQKRQERQEFLDDAATDFITSDMLPPDQALALSDMLHDPEMQASYENYRFNEALGELSVTNGIIAALGDDPAIKR